MMNLLKAFVDIALWRRGPQDLPASALLLGIVIVIYAALSVGLSTISPPPDDRVLARLGLETVFSLLWIWMVLALFHRSNRFLQTATALLGTTVLLEPLVALTQAALVHLGQSHPLMLPVMFVLISLVVWYLLINAHILRSALEVGLFAAILLTILQAVCSYALSLKLLPLKGA